MERALIVEASEDARTAALIADQLAGAGIPAHRVALPDTQAAKTFRAVEQVADVLADHALHKDDLVVAVGGEAICDLAGFVAATFNRGMKLGLVPTTLVAQADSAVGGKNAINLGRGRNLVGTIHQPVVVISDIEVACDNAERGFQAGLAEIAKHALISPSDLLGHLTGALEPVIKRRPGRGPAGHHAQHRDQGRHRQPGRTGAGRPGGAELRPHLRPRDRADPRPERRGPGRGGRAGPDGRRPPGLPPGPHPPAVVDQHRRLLTGLGLPVEGEFRLADMEQAWMRDKKYRHGVRFVVLNELGRPEGGVTADTATLDGALRDLAGR